MLLEKQPKCPPFFGEESVCMTHRLFIKETPYFNFDIDSMSRENKITIQTS